MKIKSPVAGHRAPASRRNGELPPGVRPHPIVARRRGAERGVALVVTLILLAVTLVMALAFLALSRRERNAVSTTTDMALARLAAESARAAAESQIAAAILANPAAAYNYRLLVSTNYLNTNFISGLADPTNVCYQYQNGNLLAGNDFIQNVANLQILPRVPVFVSTNAAGPLDFRFYHDLNRNNAFETNGIVAETDFTGATNGLFSLRRGDPEWVGVLERPGFPHGPNNPFVARYAFFAQPVGNSLDMNFIHNQVLDENNANPQVFPNPNAMGDDAFYRNQGAGSWEINLAAFLADLNTNQWGQDIGQTRNFYWYQYQPGNNQGAAFFDAQGLLGWRYGNLYTNLYPAGSFLANAQNVFANDNLDGYGDGALQTNFAGLDESLAPAGDGDQRAAQVPWPGSPGPNRFFALPSEVFDPYKSLMTGIGSFTNHLTAPGYSLATYDRYTFYRMMEQLGTDTGVEEGRLNLNYDNTDGLGNVVPGREVFQREWTPSGFFTNAADRMLRHYTGRWAGDSTNSYRDFTNTFGARITNGFGLTNIPVLVNGRFVYSPGVNRILQLAANLYDASTNSAFPSVFRPVFHRNGLGDVYITGYQEVTNVTGFADPLLAQPLETTAIANNQDYFGNVYGVPWIIGVKKGFPSFNQFYMRNTVQVTRKLQVSRFNGLVPGAVSTNQMLTMSITNRVGFSFWNSYNSSYTSSVPGGITIYARESLSMTLTNAQRTWTSFYANPLIAQFQVLSNNLNVWPGSAWATYSGKAAPEKQTPDPRSFISGYIDFAFLPESDFQASINDFVRSGYGVWDTAGAAVPAMPRFGLMTTNWFQGFILDGGRVIDYVQLSGPSSARDVTDEIRDKITDPDYATKYANGTLMWVTNGFMGATAPSVGVINQLLVSQNNTAGNIRQFWKDPPNIPSAFRGIPEAEAAFFSGFFNAYYNYKGKSYQNTNLVVQAPYTPTRTAWEYTVWQANDPLVHHLASDLNTTTRLTGRNKGDDVSRSDYPQPNLNALPERYQPWGRNLQMSQVGGVDSDPYNLTYRDPLVWGPDYWDFPEGKYPAAGWIGRVHRGTPWQTIYLKATDVMGSTANSPDGIKPVGANTWAQWTGHTRTSYGQPFEAACSAPVVDSDLFDLFTARIHQNAARGSLSVNQSGLASWSALLSGMVALTNSTASPASYRQPVYTSQFIQPAGPDLSAPVAGIVASINATRALFVNPDGVRGAFERVGDILRAPGLSESSPFLSRDASGSPYSRDNSTISDQAYEWLPQQAMGLLRVAQAPRYVIYCWGQALRPAPNSLVTAPGPNFGLCTNYQVVAETAARAVVRVNRNITTNNVTVPPVVGTNYTTTVEVFNALPPD